MAQLQTTAPSSLSFQQYSTALRALEGLRERKDNLEDKAGMIDQLASYLTLNVPNPGTDPNVQLTLQAAAACRDQITELVSTLVPSIHVSIQRSWEFPRRSRRVSQEQGRFVKGLDDPLKGFRVYRQAYDGGTFVGNHVRKTVKLTCTFVIR